MTELQNDRQDKNNMPPDLLSQGHKNHIKQAGIQSLIKKNNAFHLFKVI